MVLCILALPVFAILGIFSVRYRKLASDALECLFKTVTLRKCDSKLDQRIRADLTGRVMKFSPKGAGIFYKNYKIITLLLFLLFVWSTYTSAIGIYNYANYGNCNGPASTGFCLLDPSGANSAISEMENIDVPKDTMLPSLEKEDPIIGNPSADLTIIEFGCYSCPYTEKAESIVQEVLEHYQGRVNFQFKTFVIPRHPFSYEAALASNCAREQEKYAEFHDKIFEAKTLHEESLNVIAKEIGLSMGEFDYCMVSEKHKHEVNSDSFEGVKAGVIGTPTFFINDKKIVGPKPFKTFKKIIDKELE